MHKLPIYRTFIIPHSPNQVNPQPKSPTHPPPYRLFCGEMQNFHKNLVIFTALVYNERVFAEQMGYVNDLFRQTKETLHKACA